MTWPWPSGNWTITLDKQTAAWARVHAAERNMSLSRFVDANVFLYARDEKEPAKRARARDWLEVLWREERGRTSLQVLSEYYVNLKRREFSGLAPDTAWAEVMKYLAWRPQPSPA